MVDVKIDTREKLLSLRTWTKFFLKVEAVRCCFPCHLRISMMHHNAEISTNITIRINVPGINIQMTSSRKKEHIRSLSWTYNQKNTIFLSLDSKVTCEKHVKWLRMTIEDLEQYNQQLITSKRLSRSSTTEEITPKPTIYENIWENRGMRSYDSQRCPSGIYEEIPDAKTRKSVASGIYEEVLSMDSGTKEEDPMPPPLPPRLNTYQNQNPRSFDESKPKVLKKKRYRAILDSVLCLGKRRPKKGSPAILTTKFLSLDIAQGKRNSFFSPNLTKITRSVSESKKTKKTPEGYLEMSSQGFDRDKVKELDRLELQKKPDLFGYVEMNVSGFNQEAVQELDRLEAAANVELVTSDSLPIPQEPRWRLNIFDEKIPSYIPIQMVREGKRHYQKSSEVTRQANGEVQVAKRRPKPRPKDPSPEKSPDPAPETRLEV